MKKIILFFGILIFSGVSFAQTIKWSFSPNYIEANPGLSTAFSTNIDTNSDDGGVRYQWDSDASGATNIKTTISNSQGTLNGSSNNSGASDIYHPIKQPNSSITNPNSNDNTDPDIRYQWDDVYTGDGSADSNNSCGLFIKSLQLGDGAKTNKYKEVYSLQESLMKFGYLKAKPSGYFGAITQDAVKRFQKASSLPSTGTAFDKTLAALRNIFCAGSIGAQAQGSSQDTSTNPKSSSSNDSSQGGISATASEAPSSCKIWTDGCNYCTREFVGGPLTCSQSFAACLTVKLKPRCQTYFNSAATDLGKANTGSANLSPLTSPLVAPQTQVSITWVK